MRGSPGITFSLLVALVLAQVAWWIYFQVQDTRRVEVSKRKQIEGLCYEALLEIGDDLPEGASPLAVREALERRLAARYPMLELTDEPGSGGARLGRLRPDMHESLASLLIRPREKALLRILDEARRRRRMFLLEGATLTLLVLLGLLHLSRALGRERRLQAQHERFLAGATHELKTPLASLKLGLQTLSRSGLDPERSRHYLSRMSGEVDRLQIQIENLLHMAAGDRYRERREVGDLRKDVAEILIEVRRRAEEKGIEVRFEDGEDPIPVERDREALRQLVGNLFDNAFKHGPEGSTVHAFLGIEEGKAVLRIRDEGPGVPPGDEERIFEKFYRGEDAVSLSQGGSGLGLYLARQTARAHGGSLELDGSGGPGAAFELRLPLHSAAERSREAR